MGGTDPQQGGGHRLITEGAMAGSGPPVILVDGIPGTWFCGLTIAGLSVTLSCLARRFLWNAGTIKRTAGRVRNNFDKMENWINVSSQRQTGVFPCPSNITASRWGWLSHLLG